MEGIGHGCEEQQDRAAFLQVAAWLPKPRAPQSTRTSDSKLILDPPGRVSFGIGQRGIQCCVTATPLPDDAALVKNPDERTRLAAAANLNRPKLNNPAPKVRV